MAWHLFLLLPRFHIVCEDSHINIRTSSHINTSKFYTTLSSNITSRHRYHYKHQHSAAKAYGLYQPPSRPCIHHFHHAHPRTHVTVPICSGGSWPIRHSFGLTPSIPSANCNTVGLCGSRRWSFCCDGYFILGARHQGISIRGLRHAHVVSEKSVVS